MEKEMAEIGYNGKNNYNNYICLYNSLIIYYNFYLFKYYS